MESADFDEVVVAGMSLREASAAVRVIQAEEARLAAVKARVIGRVIAGRLHRHDGHRNVRAWLRAEQNCSVRTATVEVRRAELLANLAAAGQAPQAGKITVDAVDVIAGVHTNPRARQAVHDEGEVLVELAKTLPFADLQTAAAHFEACADPDGTIDSHDNAVSARRARGRFVGTEFVFDAQGDTLSGVEIMAIFDAFEQREFEADWADAKRRCGPDATDADLARTAPQRRYDAFHAAMRAAAEAGVVLLPKPLVNLVIDHTTLQATLAHLADDQPPAEAGPESFTQRRCETVDGVVVDPRQVIMAMLRGHSRRIITDTATGRAIDIGRRRFFRGAVRDAVLLNTPRCVQPGCLTPAAAARSTTSNHPTTAVPPTPTTGHHAVPPTTAPATA